MPISVREATPTEIQNWDAIVRQFPNRRVFHQRSWLQSIEAFTRARPLYLLIERDGALAAAIPGFTFRLAFLKLFASPREGWQTDSMGPVFDRDRLSTGELFAALIPFLESRYGVQHIELASPDLDAQAMRDLGFSGEPLFTYRVRLFPGDEESVLRNVQRKTRSYLRRLSRTGLMATTESDESFVSEFYDQARAVFARRGNAVPFSRRRVLELFRHMMTSDNLLALSVPAPGDRACMATALFLIEGSELHLWGWAHRAQYGRNRPIELLTWTAMRKAMEMGCVSFDMGGGGAGKPKYGGVPDLNNYRWIRSKYAWLRRSRDWARRVYRRQQSLRGRILRRAAAAGSPPVEAEEREANE